MNFAEMTAILIFYGIFYYIITTISNKISYKKIKKEVFSLEGQVYFWIEFSIRLYALASTF